jgi:penicillin amidase
VPVRAGADGSLPRVAPADGSDDWTGYIPKDRMPGMIDPPRAWVGTANNDTTPQGYPWYYTNYVAPDYRYRRIGPGAGQCEADDGGRPVETHDGRPQPAERPPAHAIVAALKDDPAQRDLAAILEKWDGVDRADQAAPLVYQALYREIALGTFSDKLGEDVTKDMLSTWYFWQQRFDALVATPDSPWFDDARTKDKRRERWPT